MRSPRADVALRVWPGAAEAEAGTLKLEPRKGGDLGSLALADATQLLARAAKQAVEPSEAL